MDVCSLMVQMHVRAHAVFVWMLVKMEERQKREVFRWVKGVIRIPYYWHLRINCWGVAACPDIPITALYKGFLFFFKSVLFSEF